MDEAKQYVLDQNDRSSTDIMIEKATRQHWDLCSECSSRSIQRGHSGRRLSCASSVVSIPYLITLHVLCFLFGTYFVLSMWIWTPGAPGDALLDFDRRYPDWVPISYELRPEEEMTRGTSKYGGLPNESNTKAWDDLIIPTFFSASLEDLQKTGESIEDSVRLAEGGYIAGLAVYHNIHCLRRLRLFLHSDYYYRNLTEANMVYLRGHLGHCIESLRRSIMCNADTTIYTFTWNDAEPVSPGIYRPRPKSSQEKKCVNWEGVEDWVMERRVDLNPILLKPSGEEEKILMI